MAMPKRMRLRQSCRNNSRHQRVRVTFHDDFEERIESFKNIVFALEFRYRFPGWPLTIRGRANLMASFSGYGKTIKLHSGDALVVHRSQDSRVSGGFVRKLLHFIPKGKAGRSASAGFLSSLSMCLSLFPLALPWESVNSARA